MGKQEGEAWSLLPTLQISASAESVQEPVLGQRFTGKERGTQLGRRSEETVTGSFERLLQADCFLKQQVALDTDNRVKLAHQWDTHNSLHLRRSWEIDFPSL